MCDLSCPSNPSSTSKSLGKWNDPRHASPPPTRFDGFLPRGQPLWYRTERSGGQRRSRRYQWASRQPKCPRIYQQSVLADEFLRAMANTLQLSSAPSQKAAPVISDQSHGNKMFLGKGRRLNGPTMTAKMPTRSSSRARARRGRGLLLQSNEEQSTRWIT